MAQSVQKKETGNVAVPDYMREDADVGKETFEREDVLMPRMKLAQAMTPEVKDEKIAAEGDLIHTITKEVLAKAGNILRVIPVAYTKEYILWRDRKDGGGILARAKRSVMPDGTVRYKWDNGNQEFEQKIGGSVKVKYKTKEFIDEDHLNEWGTQIPGDPDSKPAANVHYNYVLMLPDFDNQMVAISLSRTAVPAAKSFNSLLKAAPVAIFGRVYNLASYMDKRDDNTFANWKFTNSGEMPDKDTYMLLRDLHQSLQESGFNVDMSDEEADPETDGGSKF